jgi:hypothetical protein
MKRWGGSYKKMRSGVTDPRNRMRLVGSSFKTKLRLVANFQVALHLEEWLKSKFYFQFYFWPSGYSRTLVVVAFPVPSSKLYSTRLSYAFNFHFYHICRLHRIIWWWGGEVHGSRVSHFLGLAPPIMRRFENQYLYSIAKRNIYR